MLSRSQTRAKGKEGEPAETGASVGEGKGEIEEGFLCHSFAFIHYFTLRRYNFASHIKGTLHQYRLTERE